MPLTPSTKDRNRDKELERRKKDPKSFGIGRETSEKGLQKAKRTSNNQ